MNLNKYQWGAIIVAILSPAVFVVAKGSTLPPARQHPQVPQSVNHNLKAFLLMIQYAEGTIGINAYKTLYGGSLFHDLSRHPNKAITKGGLTSTAAGAYQILNRTWIDVQRTLKLPDFSRLSQDRAAIELIRRRGALEDVLSGRFATAVYKVRKEWASLPGAGYGQGERSYELLEKVYQSAGGYLMAA
ncbi:MAG TPA: glycoside hydrolase family 104 protein [Flavipsychrobacter sp.]|nr:glycoside hydrolase family 104 protein [Flavipsychrobacter sp.]